MNATTHDSKPRSLDTTTDEVSTVPVPSGYLDNLRYREREVGTGYGRSSGYARNRRYAGRGDEPLFRCA